MQVHIQTRPGFARPGFTLVELLVTVGIIALLFGLSLVALSHVRVTAQKTRVQDDLHLIQMALDAYRSDFQDYPRFASPADDYATQNNLGNGTWLDYANDRGARLLCQALIAPGPATSSDTSHPAGQDGADGPGFRVRRTIAGGGTTGPLSGKVYGPYLDPTKFKLESTMLNMQDAKILDIFGNPILYYPALPGPPAPQVSYVKLVDPSTAVVGSVLPLYNAYDNTRDTTTQKSLLSASDMQTILTDGGGSAITTQPYLLWSAGPSGIFGLKNGKTDNIIFNVDTPAGLRK